MKNNRKKEEKINVMGKKLEIVGVTLEKERIYLVKNEREEYFIAEEQEIKDSVKNGAEVKEESAIITCLGLLVKKGVARMTRAEMQQMCLK